MINNWKPLIIFTKSSSTDVCVDSDTLSNIYDGPFIVKITTSLQSLNIFVISAIKDASAHPTLYSYVLQKRGFHSYIASR